MKAEAGASSIPKTLVGSHGLPAVPTHSKLHPTGYFTVRSAPCRRKVGPKDCPEGHYLIFIRKDQMLRMVRL